MKTESNVSNFQKMNFKGILLNEEFIGYINTLSDSIKEFYKVSKNVNKNKNILINLAENELNTTESVINNLKKEEININDISSINTLIERLREIFNKLQLNIISEEKNIIFFFEDAKLLFKKMREKRQEYIIKLKKRSNSASKNNYSSLFSSSHYNANINFRKLKNIDLNNNSDVNCNIKNIKNSVSNCNCITNINMQPKDINTINNSRKSKTVNKNKEIKDDYLESNDESNLKSGSNFKSQNVTSARLIDTKSQNIEIEKLKMINKKLTLELKKCKSKTLESINNFADKSFKKDINYNNINLLIQDKDNIISSLKDDINKNNKKYLELMNSINNYKLEIKKLKEENNKLKQINIQSNRIMTNHNIINSISNNNKELDKNLNTKLNNLIKENKILKSNVEKLRLKSFNAVSEYNTNLGIFKNDLSFDINNNNKNNNSIHNKENELLKKKVIFLEKKLNEKQVQNKELNNEIVLLKNKHESEISKLSKKNSELSTNLVSKQNEYLSLKKENLSKRKEIENLKVSLNYMTEKQKFSDSSNRIYTDGQNNSFFSNKGNENMNKIIDKYKKENEELKEKIKYYQTQIRNIKNELYEKNQANIELENNIENKIKEIKDNYERKMTEISSQNKKLEKNFEESQNLNCDLSQQICNLNEQIKAKDVKLLELNYQIEQLQKQLENYNKENKKLLKMIEELNNKYINNNNVNKNIEELNEKLEEQKNLNNDLNEELLNIKNDNELLKNKIMSNEKKIMDFQNKESIQDDIEILNNEIENLKKENMALKSTNEQITNQLKDSLNNNNKDDIIKKKEEEIEGFKELVSKFQKDKEKIDEINNSLKRENEKMKNQIIRLSKTLPEEYNQLEKQYNDLESKYFQVTKNKNPNLSTPPSKNKNQNNNSDIKCTVEEQLTKELNQAKKEIDIIKKKNTELIRQLEEKEINKNCFDNKSEDGNKSNYEEEFDLRKMARGAREKNRSQDINIDYPGVQAIKEKYRELDFYYNSLEGLVKKLLLTIQCNPKNKTYVNELCKIVGFDNETTNKILTNKNKKLLLGLFSK